MTFVTWQEAVTAIEEVTGPATEQQRRLAEIAVLQLPTDAPRLLVAACLKTALSRDLDLPPSREVNGRHKFRINLLVRPEDLQFSPKNALEADAWITYLRLLRRREHLRELKLVKGDIVRTSDGEIAEVSSLVADGRIFFKGGGGFGAWPDLVTVISRCDDSGAAALNAKREANNTASLRLNSTCWSVAKSRDLADFKTADYVTADDIAELESVISKASDERPIQEFLGANSYLLTALLGGVERYCLPLKRFGGEYVPDFVMGDVDSLGMRWVLVELETPKSGIYVKNGSHFDKAAVKGVSQVVDWRNWLTANVSYARTKRSENGLGLFDIRPKPKGLVLVGRRSRFLQTKDAQRQEYRESNNIEVHTYDWLLESLRGVVGHHGPPATNPYLLHREHDTIWDVF